MRIIIAGDIVPTSNNIELFESGNIRKIMGEDLYKYWMNSDYRIFNLEVPLMNNCAPIKKSGPILFCSQNCINGIVALKPNLVCLANNHIMDQGKEGYNDTVKMLVKNKIQYMGVGDNKSSLKKKYIFIQERIKVGIYNCCDTEFSIASDNNPGANPFDPIESFDDVRELSKECDYVVVIYHGGKEYYRYPSPYLQKICRKFVECGANYVTCQHSHCIGSYEKYLDGTILYGQGNFIFNKKFDEFWKTGLIIEIKIECDKISTDFIPIQQNNNCICMSKNDDKKYILNDLEERSKRILKDGFIEEEYLKYSKNFLSNYIRQLRGTNLLERILYKIYKNNLYQEKDFLNIQNILQCDAHRELFLKALNNERR